MLMCVSNCAMQMFKRGGIDEVCSLLVSVGHEPVGIVSSPTARAQSQSQASTSAPEAGQEGGAEGSGPTADSAEQQSGQCVC